MNNNNNANSSAKSINFSPQGAANIENLTTDIENNNLSLEKKNSLLPLNSFVY
jgi:hypothetical protein